MVEGGSDQADRPGHVPENLIPKKLDRTDGAASHRHAIPGAAPFPGMPALVGRLRISAPVSLSA